MPSLNSRSLGDVRNDAEVPTYNRAGLTSGIVHVGVGGFHRAHLAAYQDQLLSAGLGEDWAITGVGVLAPDETMKEVLTAQDCLYTLAVKHPDGTLSPRIIGSLVDYMLVSDDAEAVIETMAAATTHIVSLTITEGGYGIDEVISGVDDPAAASTDFGPDGLGTTVFGLVVEALARRRDRNLPPFTVMSCDNIDHNGEVAREAFVQFARLRDTDLADWLESAVAFPSSMVDRITPATTDENRAEVAAATGLEDAWPVVCEAFLQWVLQDTFCDGRPRWEEVGVQVVEDVQPYERMKLRLLNGGHQALSYLGYLCGHRYVHEAAHDPAIASFLRSYLDREVTPTLDALPGVDLEEYKSTLMERFANPSVGDTLARICTDASDRIPTFVLPVIEHQLAQGGEVSLGALVVASWARYAEGADEDGEPIDVVDPLQEKLTAAAGRQHENPVAFLEAREVFGDLVEDDDFTEAYVKALASLHDKGAQATVAAALATAKQRPL